MVRFSGWLMLAVALLLGVTGASYGTTLDQRLELVTNTKTLGGAFQVAVQVKGTDLTAANTLGSATIDVEFDNTKLTFVSGTGWAFATANGYSRSANDITTYIRIAVTGGGVGADAPGDPAGFDITTSYTTWVLLNFTIADVAGDATLTINPGSNAIGLFANHANNPNTGVITDQPLSAPIVITGEPLPIQLASFTAAIQQESGSVLVKWSTASETNNYGFEVQKAPEGSSEYQTIPNSFVAGHGTTVDAHSYSFTDVSVTPGVWYYRLKQTDLDGAIHYSDGIRPTNVTGVEDRPLPTVFALDQNYPNPFNPSTTIEFALPTESQVRLEVYDVLGQLVATLVDDFRPAGYYAQRFDASALGTGIYFYRLSAGENSFLKKMLLVK